MWLVYFMWVGEQGLVPVDLQAAEVLGGGTDVRAEVGVCLILAILAISIHPRHWAGGHQHTAQKDMPPGLVGSQDGEGERGGRGSNDRAVTCDRITPALCLALQDINERKEEGPPTCLGLSPQMLQRCLSAGHRL